MNILFIDTHSSIINISLIIKDKVFSKEKESINSHSVFLLPLLEELLNENNINIREINKIIVVNGPGSFTGLRIGLSVVKIIGYILNIPVIPISSLTAFLVSNDISENKMCVIEDNKGYYISVFDKFNKNIIEEKYVEDIAEYDYKTVENKLDILKIYDFIKANTPIIIHNLKANYIKKIEAEK